MPSGIFKFVKQTDCLFFFVKQTDRIFKQTDRLWNIPIVYLNKPIVCETYRLLRNAYLFLWNIQVRNGYCCNAQLAWDKNCLVAPLTWAVRDEKASRTYYTANTINHVLNSSIMSHRNSFIPNELWHLILLCFLYYYNLPKTQNVKFLQSTIYIMTNTIIRDLKSSIM
jgi:hypothetical protein